MSGTSGPASLKPVFVFNPERTRWAGFAVVGIFFLIAIGTLFLYPIAVSGFILWGGFAVFSAYSWKKMGSLAVTKAYFYDDRIEVNGSQTGVYRYMDIESVYVSNLTKWGKIVVRGRGRAVWLGPKPKKGSAEDFYDWLGQKLEGTGVSICLPAGGVGSPYSGAIVALVMAPLVVYFVIFGVILGFFGPSASDSFSGLAGGGPALATFLYLARRQALKEDNRAVMYHVKESGSEGISFLAGMKRHLLGKGTRWVPAILLLQVLGTIAVVFLPFLPGESAYFLQLYVGLQQELGTTPLTQFAAIFSNNLHVLVISFVPVYGPLTLTGVTYNTARVVESVVQNGSVSPLSYLLRSFSLPHTWLELSAYSIGIFEGLSIPYSWGPWGQTSRFKNLISLVDEVTLVLVISIGVLALAGTFEVLEPRMSNPYVLWVPTFVLVAIAVIILLKFRVRTTSVD